jgi:aspartate/methionine/tyrosine aminotransferase
MSNASDTMVPQTTSGPVTSSADWKLDSAELAALFNSKTKAIIVNNPHNPLGKVFSRQELEEICQLAIEHDVLVIADDV